LRRGAGRERGAQMLAPTIAIPAQRPGPRLRHTIKRRRKRIRLVLLACALAAALI
jgi:hypothetical protein